MRPFRMIALGCFVCAAAYGQGVPPGEGRAEPAGAHDRQQDYVLRPKPWLLRKTTKDWQWVAVAPKIYHPPHLDPLEFPAIIEHEKVHLSQQRASGKYRWLIRYVFSKKFRFAQELEPIVVEMANTPQGMRASLAVKYARSLSGGPYSKAAKSPQVALEGILAKAAEMGVALE